MLITSPYRRGRLELSAMWSSRLVFDNHSTRCEVSVMCMNFLWRKWELAKCSLRGCSTFCTSCIAKGYIFNEIRFVGEFSCLETNLLVVCRFVSNMELYVIVKSHRSSLPI